MKAEIPNFTKNQWEFLALLKAFEEPVHLDILEALCPLPLSRFMELLGRKKKFGWINEVGANRYAIIDNLPSKVIEKLRRINTTERISGWVQKLKSPDLKDRANLKVVNELIVKSGTSLDVAGFEIDLARKAVKNDDMQTAIKEYRMAVNRLYDLADKPDHGALFVSTILELIELTNLFFQTPTVLDDLPTSVRFMKKARIVAKRLGDKRSQALINLYMGSIFFIYGQLDNTLNSLSKGLKEAEQLGDDDILQRSAPYLGWYYYLRGMFNEALPYFERVIQTNEFYRKGNLTPGTNFVVGFMGFTLTLLGWFHDSIGFFACHWRLAKARSQHEAAAVFRALLGSILLIMKKNKEATYHLEGACKEAEAVDSENARYLAEGSLIYLHFMEGRIDKAKAMIDPVLSRGLSGDMIHQYTTSHYLEMLFELDRMTTPPHPRINFQNSIASIMKGPNIHLKGVAMRLQAKQAVLSEENVTKIQAYLSESEAYLKQSGDPIELAKTWLEKARLEVKKGNQKKSRSLVLAAVEKFDDYADTFFPDDLKFLRENKGALESSKDRSRNFISRFLLIFESLSFKENIEETMIRLLKITNRLFGTERGALFWFDQDTKTTEPRMAASYNFTEFDLADPDFKSSMTGVLKAFRTKDLVIQRQDDRRRSKKEDQVKEFLCIPIHIEGETLGVLYHDNIYLDNNFDLLDPLMLNRLINHVGGYINQNVAYNRLRKERDLLAFGRRSQLQSIQKDEIQFKSPVMAKLISQTDHIATLDSTVLIQGETGVGKELLAHRIYNMSPRCSKAMEIVDLTTIPENLLESELFGYEKGAFTGADRQKRGRIEIANGGTLFLDEIGDIPLSFQIKLLRVLQEKTFVRIGGARPITSDFRLIVATNRNLEEEVAAGHFRKDLYYRLNVIPITIPPLRERREDIVLLARYFLSRHTTKHNHENITLTPEDEDRLTAYPWPGNVRELENIIERAVILSKDLKLDLDILNISDRPLIMKDIDKPDMDAELEGKLFQDYPTLDTVQRHYIGLVLEQTGGKIYGPDGASKILGLKRTTLYARMKKLGMR